jgi:Polysaccharide lyase
MKSLINTSKTIISSALLVASLFSCSKKEMMEPAAQHNNTVASATAANSNLFINEDMEGSKPFTTFGGGIENCLTDWTFSFPALAYEGNKSVRFEIRKDQPLVGSSQRVRSEVTIVRGTEFPGFTKEAWYSFAIYFPAVGFESDDTRDCINQWFEDGSDETTIRAEKDQAFLEVTPEAGSTTLYKYDLFGTSKTTSTPTSFTKIPKDEWHEFVFHFIHSTGSDGLIEVWRDGVKIHTINGRNMHLKLPKWKIGLYKSSFLSKTSARDSRVLYFDNVRVGGANATFADMSANKGTITTPPAPPVVEETTVAAPEAVPSAPVTVVPPVAVAGQKVVSFTLVNSAIEKDIMTITDGATISLKKIDAKKLNVRANLANGTSAQVKMELSGAFKQTFTDATAPYALFDDVNGNYKSWTAITGKYKLKATVGGAEYKISFTIAK